MAAKPIEIEVSSYAEDEEGEILFDSLPEDSKREKALQLKLRWLNSIFSGEKEFYIPNTKSKKADM